LKASCTDLFRSLTPASSSVSSDFEAGNIR
jgi:hypothetical protein